jgi:hypothetical protein
MADLRMTDTNAADDASGEAFGLTGNLYLPVVIGTLASMALWAVLAFIVRMNPVVAAIFAALPLGGVLTWIFGLATSPGRPANGRRCCRDFHAATPKRPRGILRRT